MMEQLMNTIACFLKSHYFIEIEQNMVNRTVKCKRCGLLSTVPVYDSIKLEEK